MSQNHVEDMKAQCMSTLQKLGASEDIIKFYSEALQCEYDISHTIYKLQCKLKNDSSLSGVMPPNVVFGILQTMTKHFRMWKSQLEGLSNQGLVLPILNLDAEHLNNINTITAVCSMDTNEMNLKEGEQLQITDASHPNWLKVRNIRGEEGFLPTMSCLIPTPDANAITAVERLQVLLLTSWTECIRQLRPILIASCSDSSQYINQLWTSFACVNSCEPGKRREKLNGRFKRIVDCLSRNNTTIDFNKLHIYLSKLENDLLNINPSIGVNGILRSVEGLDRAVLCYQSLFNQWSSFRKSLNESSRPIRIVEHWEELRRMARFKQFKYYEMKMTLEEVDVVEEVVQINEETGESYTSECRKMRQKVVAEELKSTKHEERKKFIIKGVVDPRSGDHVAFKYAVAEGIINHKKGIYVNPDTGESLPIQRAMLEGKIIVEYTSVSTSLPETTAVPLITIKRRIDHKYVITGALDPITAERLDLQEAIKRNIIDFHTGEYVNENKGGERISEEEAVEDGWILARFDNSAPEYEIETFSVVGVLDHRFGVFLSFMQAVRKGLVDAETGDYVSNLTGRKVYAVDAIRRGLIKAFKCSSDNKHEDNVKSAVGNLEVLNTCNK